MFKVVWNIIKSIFSFIFRIFSPLKRLICRRKRRDSDTILPLANHYTIPEDFTTIPNPSNQSELQAWDSWEADENKQKYNQNGRSYPHSNQRQTSQEEEPEPDYFTDMVPKIKKQKKVFIGGKKNSNKSSNMFAVSNDGPIVTGSELGAWDDSQTGWEGEAIEDLSTQAEAELREKRRQERLYQQQKKKQERDSSKGIRKDKHLTAVKLS